MQYKIWRCTLKCNGPKQHPGKLPESVQLELTNGSDSGEERLLEMINLPILSRFAFCIKENLLWLASYGLTKMVGLTVRTDPEAEWM